MPISLLNLYPSFLSYLPLHHSLHLSQFSIASRSIYLPCSLSISLCISPSLSMPLSISLSISPSLSFHVSFYLSLPLSLSHSLYLHLSISSSISLHLPLHISLNLSLNVQRYLPFSISPLSLFLSSHSLCLALSFYLSICLTDWNCRALVGCPILLSPFADYILS